MKQFAAIGWFEEVMVWTAKGWKLAGKRVLQAPPSGPLGAASEREFTATAPLSLMRGCGETTILRASPAKPARLKSRTYPLCGPLQ